MAAEQQDTPMNGQFTTTPLTSLRALYAIDNSGSTAGYILRAECESVKLLMQYVGAAHGKVISWSSWVNAVSISHLQYLSSGGGTQPAVICRHMNSDTEMVILYTDGQITHHAMEDFRKKMVALRLRESLPVIIVLTLSDGYDEQHTLKTVERQVNMSIPEALLTISNHTLILVNCSMMHKVLMSTGSFVSMFRAAELTPNTRLCDLPDFELGHLQAVQIKTVPPGCIILDGEVISTEALYDPAHHLSLPLLRALCDRAVFPRLDTKRLHQKLSVLNRELSRNPAIDGLHKTLAEIVADPKRAGTEEHHRVLAEFRLIKNSGSRCAEATEKRRIIAHILELISSYTKDKTSIAFGSNRAANAREIAAKEFDDIGACVTVECPVFLTEGPACILLTKPDEFEHYFSAEKHDYTKARSLVEYSTSDTCMEAPFHFGSVLEAAMTKGVFCLEFASQAKTNPYTRESVIGHLPLSKHPKVIMNYMSKIFGGSRELWHMVRGYLGMVATHVKKRKWAEADILHTHAMALVSNYHCTLTLNGKLPGIPKRPLLECLRHVCRNYQTCLRDRMANDVLVILDLVCWLMPDYDFDGNLQKIRAMTTFVDLFQGMLVRVKKGESMVPFVMELDEYEHHVAPKKDLRSLIARVLWNDQNGKCPVYCGMKLQFAVNTALADPEFGPSLVRAFVGDVPHVEDESILEIALPEPEGFYFQPPGLLPHIAKELETEGHLSTEICAYSGKRFTRDPCDQYSQSPLLEHIRKELGPHFYKGQKAVRFALIDFVGTTCPSALSPCALPKKPPPGCPATISVKDIFLKAKERLYSWHGHRNGALHTQRCKAVLLHFISKLAVYCGIQDRLVYEQSSVDLPSRQPL